MAKKIIWSKEALDNVDSIAEFIARDSRYYASAFVVELFGKADTLKTLFNRGRIVPEISKENIREIFVGDYRIVYKIEKEQIQIVTIIHGSRDIKKLLKKKR